jgi:hypothetical protein
MVNRYIASFTFDDLLFIFTNLNTLHSMTKLLNHSQQNTDVVLCESNSFLIGLDFTCV